MPGPSAVLQWQGTSGLNSGASVAGAAWYNHLWVMGAGWTKAKPPFCWPVTPEGVHSAQSSSLPQPHPFPVRQGPQGLSHSCRTSLVHSDVPHGNFRSSPCLEVHTQGLGPSGQGVQVPGELQKTVRGLLCSVRRVGPPQKGRGGGAVA